MCPSSPLLKPNGWKPKKIGGLGVWCLLFLPGRFSGGLRRSFPGVFWQGSKQSTFWGEETYQIVTRCPISKSLISEDFPAKQLRLLSEYPTEFFFKHIYILYMLYKQYIYIHMTYMYIFHQSISTFVNRC